MDRRQTLHCFYLHHNGVRHQHVHTISAVEFQTFVIHRQRQFPAEGQVPQVEFVTETLDIGGLQQARPKGSMDLNCGSDHTIRNLVN